MVPFRSLLLKLAVAVVLGQGCQPAETTVKQNRPNILFAISDDQSWLHTGFAGCEWIKTPEEFPKPDWAD